MVCEADGNHRQTLIFIVAESCDSIACPAKLRVFSHVDVLSSFYSVRNPHCLARRGSPDDRSKSEDEDQADEDEADEDEDSTEVLLTEDADEASIKEDSAEDADEASIEEDSADEDEDSTEVLLTEDADEASIEQDSRERVEDAVQSDPAGNSCSQDSDCLSVVCVTSMVGYLKSAGYRLGQQDITGFSSKMCKPKLHDFDIDACTSASICLKLHAGYFHLLFQVWGHLQK